jgi:hypothetical protein
MPALREELEGCAHRAQLGILPGWAIELGMVADMRDQLLELLEKKLA